MVASHADRVRAWSDGRTNYFLSFYRCLLSLTRSPNWTGGSHGDGVTGGQIIFFPFLARPLDNEGGGIA
jgi:hypothetical protein